MCHAQSGLGSHVDRNSQRRLLGNLYRTSTFRNPACSLYLGWPNVSGRSISIDLSWRGTSRRARGQQRFQ